MNRLISEAMEDEKYSVDRMFERLEKLFEAERQFTSDASHELRTPTAIILAECDRAERKAESVEDYEETIGHIREQGERMSGLIDELLGITRLQQGTERYPLSEGDLSEFVTLSSEEFVPDEEKGIRMETDIEDGSAVLRVSDNGRGIAAEDLDKIWQRFWQADSSRGNGGSGLGLAMVKEVADLHGGSVAVKSTLGKGSEFSFSIPAQQI